MANQADTTNPRASRKCSVEGCERDLRPPSAKGMCSVHYYRMKKTGTTDRRVISINLCTVPNCSLRVKSNGLCVVHETRRRRGKDLNSAKRVSAGTTQRWLEERALSRGEGCLTWPYARYPNGYGGASLNGVRGLAHRFMCTLAHGAPPEDKPLATHSCGKGHEGCVAPWHLSWGTHKSNAEDRETHGTHPHGEESQTAKLTAAQAVEIFMSLETSPITARRYGVNEKTVYRIRWRKAWTEVTDGLISPRPVRKKRRA